MSNPRFPVYIISKGRWEARYTARALEAIGVPYRIVIEPQEYAQYAAVISPDKILMLPFSNLGQGSIPARNWVWEHAKAEGHERHWILDDNLQWFDRVHQNKKIRLTTGVGFRAVEDFVLRYQNVALAGLQYDMFLPALQKAKPIIFNTRIYSCILIDCRLPFRWRGRYNEDTDLSLRILKAGWCTLLFNSFLCKKVTTMTCKGGNMTELYKQDAAFDGRLEMARSLWNQHPDVVKIKRRFGRWQHVVNYKPFRTNRLLLKPGVLIQPGSDNYGMALVATAPTRAQKAAQAAAATSKP